MAYEVRIDNFDRDEWEQCALGFDRYNLYQTCAYQEVRADKDKQDISRIIIKDESGEIMLMCQVRIMKVRLLGLRIGYVQWGPMIRTCGMEKEKIAEVLGLLVRAYVGHRVKILRLVPNICVGKTSEFVVDSLQAGGFRRISSVSPYHTMLFPLDISEEEMRNRLHRKWRRELRKGERNKIEIREGSDEQYLEILNEFYKKIQKRKKFKGLDLNVFVETQRLLLPHQKMNAIVAYYDGEPLTVDITSYLGDTALGLFQASSEKGLNLRSSYLTWWETLLAAKRAGMKVYDLGGIDPEGNPSVYRFKSRMGAKEVFYIGAFEAYSNSIAGAAWHAAERMYHFVKSKLSQKSTFPIIRRLVAT